jgi:hypothetical protein
MPPYESLSSIGLVGLLSIAFSIQTFSLVVAALVTPAILIVARIREDRRVERGSVGSAPAVEAWYRAERVTLGIAAGAVIVAFVFVYHVPGYLFDLVNVVEWWKYATPVFAAAVGVAAAFVVIASKRSHRAEQPVLAPTRRTWASFSGKMGLIGLSVSAVALVGTTIAAGSASSADAAGRFIYLDLIAPNASMPTVRPWFYGWAFGVPVLICTAALIAVVWLALHANASRAYRRAVTVNVERLARTRTATAIARIGTGGMLLALGGAWRFIAEAGRMSRVVIDGGAQEQTFDTTWRYAEFALAAGWLAPAVEITALVLLLLAVSDLRTARSRHRAAPNADPVAETAAAR